MSVLGRMARSKTVEVAATVLVYAFYATVVAVSLAPSAWLVLRTVPGLLAPVLAPHTGALRPEWFRPAAGSVVRAALGTAAMVAVAGYLYVIVGAFIQASLVRVLSLGIRPGQYPAVSVTTMRWLVYSGIYAISTRTVLPFVTVTFVINMYFRIVGCRMGKNVKLNTFMLNDAYLLTIEDDVVVGGDTDVSCHLFENNHLILQPVTIGRGSLIGAHSYISPGVIIGSGCVVGLNCYIRSGHVIPDGARITAVAGIDLRTAREIERRGPRYGRTGPCATPPDTKESTTDDSSATMERESS